LNIQNNKIKRGQEIELAISDLAFGGKGISKINDLIFFVKDAVPNQKVIAKVNKVKKNYIEAYKIEVLKKSDNETTPKCEHFKYCGGCTIQQLNYQNQLQYKQKQVFEIMDKIGTINNPKINPIIPCDKIFYYRNKMEYTFSDNPWYVKDESYDNVVIGLHVPKRFDKILNINQCHINHKTFNDIISICKQVSNKEKLIPYDVVKHTGFLRYLMIRIGVHTDEIMINFVTAGFEPKMMYPFVDAIKNEIPNISSIVNTINNEKNNTATGNTKLLHGKEFITEKIGKYHFKISANSFFQTNSYQVKNLYEYIKKSAKLDKNDILYDLYCGTGTIGIYLSKYVKKIYGIEIVEDAIIDAKYNAEINNVKNIDFFCGDLKNTFQSDYFKKIEKPDVVIIDPPRPGLHPTALNEIVKLSPSKIIYVSCNPSTQARDIKLFIENKYLVKDIQPLDMFPHTPHIESIITLKK